MKTMPGNMRKRLLYAAESGDYLLLREILDSYGEPDIRDYYGNTPLMLAARNGYARTVGALINAGADVNAYNLEQDNALILAAREAHPRMVRFLLEHGAHSPSDDSQALADLRLGESAVIANRYSTLICPDDEPWSYMKIPSKLRGRRIDRLMSKVVGLLISAGADINILDDDGESPLHNFLWLDMDDCVRELLKHEPDLNIVSGCGDTPLGKALMNSKEELALLFLDAGADPNAGIDDLRPILFAANEVYGVSPDTLRKLVAAGADVNTKNSNGETPLHMAVNNSNEVIQILLDAGADPNISDELVYG